MCRAFILLIAGLGSLQYVLEEGERDDWFNSVAIVRLSIVAAIALVVLIIWELSPKNKHPIVDLRVLKNKSFTAGLILFLALGFGLYGGIFIFPLFTQNVLGFSPTATGLVLLPGGLATAVSAMISGRILAAPKKIVDPRVLDLDRGRPVHVVDVEPGASEHRQRRAGHAAGTNHPGLRAWVSCSRRSTTSCSHH